MASSDLSLETKLPLLNAAQTDGHTGIPQLGFGVYESPPHVTYASVTAALEAGYRHIDTAQFYENEAEVGRAVRDFLSSPNGAGVSRGDVFVTTKILGVVDGSVEKTLASLRASVHKVDLGGCIDLFLIHTPQCGPEGRLTLWRCLNTLKREGLARHIGVSNFGVGHLGKILELCQGEQLEQPSVNQIELHPYLQQPAITRWCQEHGVVVEAYCPLTRGERMQNPVLQDIAKSTNKTAAQVLVRWSLQRGFVPLPKSDTPSRIRENAAVFDFVLSDEQMKQIDALDANDAIFHNPVDAE